MNSSDKDDLSMKSGSSHNSNDNTNNKKKRKKNKNKNKNKNKSVDLSMGSMSDRSIGGEEEEIDLKRVVKEINSDNDNKSSKSEESKQSNKEPEADGFDVDKIIKQLLSVQNKAPGSRVDLDLKDIQSIIARALVIVKSQPMLLELQAPLVIGTDVHGQYYDLLRFFNDAGTPPESQFLFLGDYVDRGKQSIESLCLLFAFKIKYPNRISLLRGNHEDQNITKLYGFVDECKRRYNMKLWKEFINLFNHLPITALINNKIMCMHGGLSPDLKNFDQIKSLSRPTQIPEAGVLCDILWSDPAPSNSPFVCNLIPRKWGDNDRGVSYVFSETVVKEFQAKHGLDLIVRGHQVQEDGYEFFADKKLVTIFSSPNYCNEFDNDGAMLHVGEDLQCSFYLLSPAEKAIKKKQEQEQQSKMNFMFHKKRPGTPLRFR